MHQPTQTFIVYTTAPAAYDYEGCTQALPIDVIAKTRQGGGRPFRKVAIRCPAGNTFNHVNQTRRYQSGNHLALSEEQFREWVETGLVSTEPVTTPPPTGLPRPG